ncbi:hypothetical protein K2173_002346 [Erythroxylum novogranatense]|uniref:Uncharacterized protein n=1 Tax=Erythroxylum novogranatense TaxID=1862640 RepID=A0AAV8TBA8_9ROSI|nr:hypothetical protein K2173_002346 [Erythroxylum novogranatense]
MGLMLLKKMTLFFLLVSTSFLSASAGGRFKLTNNLVEEGDEELAVELSEDGVTTVHERLLRANTKDYGKYDSAPALVKPPFKLIPN